ncbi:MAG: hypothetical protein KDA41_09845 [Planctomycetales bacterium]|nr:hypothetical protein [Planctomycetales bacterium]
MASRTELVCLCEGEKGASIDPVFINRLIRNLKPAWLRKTGSNFIDIRPQGGRRSLIRAFPNELRLCMNQGANTTLMVWADLDDDMKDGEQLVEEFRKAAVADGISDDDFKKAVFIFAKDRLENWIEFLEKGATDEAVEGPRVLSDRRARDAAKTLADRCAKQQAEPPLPPSLLWSCRNWRRLVERMKQ